MSWRKVKLGEFLQVRKERFKPNDKAILGLKRIDKIDFSGNIFLSEKPSKTDMILVKKGDLVISGINVEKGAMSVYQGDKDVTATIHYSSYEFDCNKIDIDFLKYFLKSAEFKEALKEQVPGGIKTEIKPKHLLPLEVEIPIKVSDQKLLVKNLNFQFSQIDNLSTEFTHQLDLIKKLRQQILKDAMQGKLVPQNPEDEPASKLLEKIKAEKAKSGKKEKPLSEIKPEEIPFNIPENWVWCRLGEITIIQRGSSPRPKGDQRYFSKTKTEFNWITISDISSFCKNNILQETTEFLTEEGSRQSRYVDVDNFIIAVSGSTTGKCCITGITGFIYDGLAVAKTIDNTVNSRFLFYYMTHLYAAINNSKSGASFPNINTDYLNNLIFPLPFLSEQNRIVSKIEKLMTLCDELEASVIAGQEYTRLLYQTALKEALQN